MGKLRKLTTTGQQMSRFISKSLEGIQVFLKNVPKRDAFYVVRDKVHDDEMRTGMENHTGDRDPESRSS